MRGGEEAGRDPRLLAERSFPLLLFGWTVSFAGNAVAPIALAFAVLHLTGSAEDLGVVLAARNLAAVGFLVVGGVVADRLPKQLVMVSTSVLAAASQAAAATLLLSGAARIWQLALLELVNGAVTGFWMPAAKSLIPGLVNNAQLARANALLRMGRNAMTILGAALGGAIVAVIGPGWGIAIDSVTFLLAAAAFAAVRTRHVPVAAANPLRDLVAGWREFRSRTWLWTVVVQFTFLMAAYAGAVEVLGPVVAKRELGGAAVWGAIVAAQGCGFLCGGLASMWLSVRRNLLAGNVALLLNLPLMALLAITPPVGVLLVAGFASGVGIEIFGVNWDLTMQRELPPDKLARLYAYDGFGSFVAVPLGQTVAGPAAGLFGLPGAIWGATLIATVTIVAVFGVRDVRALVPAGSYP